MKYLNLGVLFSVKVPVSNIICLKCAVRRNKLYKSTFTARFVDFEEDGEEEDESDGEWQQELQRRYEQDANFMAELRARHPSTSPGAPPGQPGQGVPQQQVGAPYC